MIQEKGVCTCYSMQRDFANSHDRQMSPKSNSSKAVKLSTLHSSKNQRDRGTQSHGD